MQARLEQLVERVKETAKEKPFVFVGIAVAVVAVSLFWNQLLILLRGVFYAALALSAIFAIIVVWAKLSYRKPPLKRLFAEKKRLLQAIKIAEHRYMKRKLSESDFNSIFKEKQKRQSKPFL